MKKFCALLLSAAILFSFNGCALFMGGEFFEDGGDDPVTDYSPNNYSPTNNYTPETDVPDESTTLYPGVYHGEVYMTDGGTYHMKENDKVDFLIPGLTPETQFVSAWYYGNGVTAVGFRNDSKCNVYAATPGEAYVGVYYSIMKEDGEWQELNCEMKIIIESMWPTVPADNENNDYDYDYNYNYNYNDWGNGAYDVCDNCYGTGKMPCPTCDGEGNLGPPSYNPCPSSYCVNGYVPCPCY